MFSTDSVIRGHHVYKDVWTPVIDECASVNLEILGFAVSVIKESTIIVGHLPHKISAICSMFLHTGVTIIDAEMTGSTFDTC